MCGIKNFNLTRPDLCLKYLKSPDLKVLRPLTNSKRQFSSLAHSSVKNLLNSARLQALVRSPLMNLLHSKRWKILMTSCRPSPVSPQSPPHTPAQAAWPPASDCPGVPPSSPPRSSSLAAWSHLYHRPVTCVETLLITTSTVSCILGPQRGTRAFYQLGASVSPPAPFSLPPICLHTSLPITSLLSYPLTSPSPATLLPQLSLSVFSLTRIIFLSLSNSVLF